MLPLALLQSHMLFGCFAWSMVFTFVSEAAVCFEVALFLFVKRISREEFQNLNRLTLERCPFPSGPVSFAELLSRYEFKDIFKSSGLSPWRLWGTPRDCEACPSHVQQPPPERLPQE